MNVQAERIPVLVGGENKFVTTAANTKPDGTGVPMVALVAHVDSEGVRTITAMTTHEARAFACNVIALASDLDRVSAQARPSPILITS